MRLIDFVSKSLGAIKATLLSLSSKRILPTASSPLQPRLRRMLVMPYDIVTADPPPMHWAPCSAQSMAKFKASMTCPDGHGLILRNHAIASDGSVSPSVVCPTPQCDFHEFVLLKGWHYGAFTE